MLQSYRIHVALLLTCVAASAAVAQMRQRPNVLFIGADDLRPEMRCYGARQMVTPALDRLCEQGVRFDQAFCNIAVCGASRASIMKGLRPTPHRFTTWYSWAEKDAPDVPSLPMVFKQQGYHTASIGKVYHNEGDDAGAWSEPEWRTDSIVWALPENSKAEPGYNRGKAYEAADQPDAEYPDHKLCDRAIETLRRLAGQDKPFFLACGFLRPHLPFVAPKKYWDLYPPDRVTLPDNMFFPRDLPAVFRYEWEELRAYTGIPKKGPVSPETARDLIRGYAACVTFVDTQIGRLLDELDRSGKAGNTIVVLWGDHGWQLGEHGFWCKHTNFEVAARAPLIIRAPGIGGGRVSRRLVEYVDMYPTLCELAGIALPSHLQGKSLGPLLRDVDARHKEAVFTRFGNGDAVRTDQYRYMEKRADGGSGTRLGVGLFDLEKDPQENRNVAEDPEYGEVRQRLAAMLDAARGSGDQ